MFVCGVGLAWVGETYERSDPGQQTAPAGEDGQETEHDRRERGPERHGIGDEHPPAHTPIGVHGPPARIPEQLVLQLLRVPLNLLNLVINHIAPLADLWRIGARLRRRVQTPHGNRIEVEPATPPGTIPVPRVAVLRAVVPEVDLVGVGDAVLLLRELQRGGEGRRVLQVAGGGGGEVREVGLEEVVVGQHGGVPAGELDEDEADGGGDGEEHGGEDAGDAGGFAHGCGGGESVVRLVRVVVLSLSRV